MSKGLQTGGLLDVSGGSECDSDILTHGER